MTFIIIPVFSSTGPHAFVRCLASRSSTAFEGSIKTFTIRKEMANKYFGKSH